jgi:hypothetical protein
VPIHGEVSSAKIQTILGRESEAKRQPPRASNKVVSSLKELFIFYILYKGNTISSWEEDPGMDDTRYFDNVPDSHDPGA